MLMRYFKDCGSFYVHQFVIAISVLSTCPSPHRLNITFDLFDADGNGFIERAEMFRV